MAQDGRNMMAETGRKVCLNPDVDADLGVACDIEIAWGVGDGTDLERC